ncbi:MAG: hypothetical protein ACI9BD_000578 [Candidatus Marinamargulisbacteria bacterium]|jgi:hypothetical protein
MNTLKINGLVLVALLLIGSSTVWAHSDAEHKKDPTQIKHEVKEALGDKSVPELWIYINGAVKDLAMAMKEKHGSKKSKEELIRLKKALDIVQEKQLKHHEDMTPSSNEKKEAHKMHREKQDEHKEHH